MLFSGPLGLLRMHVTGWSLPLQNTHIASMRPT
jgi:hypothetical protein